ncbi:MAG: LysR family transcriptional regulator [Proteobacteria bacterium]|nr:LysR family transcriptional regulator [Pseudomonadota bacterium]
MQIERHEIRVFSAVVEEGGFSRAAERLNITQSAVSQALANLEHKLDAMLLVRGRKPELTEAGKRLFSFTRTVLNEEKQALDDIGRIKSGALSTLSLAMNSMFNRFFGRKLLLEFCERNPLTRLKLDVAPSREIVYGVDQDRWELGIGPFQSRMPGHFVQTPFFSETRHLVVHERHPRFKAFMAKPESELAQATLLTSYLDDATKRPGVDRIRNQVASVWEVSDLDMRLALAEAGMGVTYLSDRVLAETVGFHPIESLGISALERPVGLYYKRHKALSESAKRFIAICQQEFS